MREGWLFAYLPAWMDSGAGFSETDLRNSCPWYSFVVLSIREGKFDHAKCWLPDTEQSKAEPEELLYPAVKAMSCRKP